MTAIEAAVTIAAGVSAGLTGGVYLAFAAIVIPALRKLSVGEAISAMQSINTSAVRFPFMIVFFGGALAAVAVIGSEIASGAIAQERPLRTIGAALALVSVGITVVRNVPLNTALASAAAFSPGASTAWDTFDSGWSLANGMRAIVAAAGCVALMASLARPLV